MLQLSLGFCFIKSGWCAPVTNTQVIFYATVSQPHTIDLSGWIILCCEGCPQHHKMFSRIFGPFSLNVSNAPTPCSCDDQNVFRYWGAPGWLSWLSDRLRLRSWSRGLWVWALHRALCWQLRAQSLLWILCLPLSLSLPHSYFISLCFSKISKCKKI